MLPSSGTRTGMIIPELHGTINKQKWNGKLAREKHVRAAGIWEKSGEKWPGQIWAELMHSSIRIKKKGEEALDMRSASTKCILMSVYSGKMSQ